MGAQKKALDPSKQDLEVFGEHLSHYVGAAAAVQKLVLCKSCKCSGSAALSLEDSFISF